MLNETKVIDYVCVRCACWTRVANWSAETPSSDPASSDRRQARTAATARDGSTGYKWRNRRGSKSRSGTRYISSIVVLVRPKNEKEDGSLSLRTGQSNDRTHIRTYVREYTSRGYIALCESGVRKYVFPTFFLSKEKENKKKRGDPLEKPLLLHFYRYTDGRVSRICNISSTGKCRCAKKKRNNTRKKERKRETRSYRGKYSSYVHALTN